MRSNFRSPSHPNTTLNPLPHEGGGGQKFQLKVINIFLNKSFFSPKIFLDKNYLWPNFFYQHFLWTNISVWSISKLNTLDSSLIFLVMPPLSDRAQLTLRLNLTSNHVKLIITTTNKPRYLAWNLKLEFGVWNWKLELEFAIWIWNWN